MSIKNRSRYYKSYYYLFVFVLIVISVVLFQRILNSGNNYKTNNTTENLSLTSMTPTALITGTTPKSLIYDNNAIWKEFTYPELNIYFKYPSEVQVSQSLTDFIVEAYAEDGSTNCSGGAYTCALWIRIRKPEANPDALTLRQWIKERGFVSDEIPTEIANTTVGKKPAVSIRYLGGPGANQAPSIFVVEREDGFMYIEAGYSGNSKNYPMKEVFNRMWSLLTL